MKEKFTPGPWKVDEYERGSFDIRVHGEPCIIVARNDHPNPDESFANARLIAAAPDMYEALKAFKAYMVGPRDLQALLIMVDAAIAKADGIA